MTTFYRRPFSRPIRQPVWADLVAIEPMLGTLESIVSRMNVPTVMPDYWRAWSKIKATMNNLWAGRPSTSRYVPNLHTTSRTTTFSFCSRAERQRFVNRMEAMMRAEIRPEDVTAGIDPREKDPLTLSPLRTVSLSMPTGDYTVVGLEHVVAIEGGECRTCWPASGAMRTVRS